MGEIVSQSVPKDVSEWQEHTDAGNGVRVMVYADHNPVLCAVYDGNEQVSKPIAALQLEDQVIAAEAFSDAKEKYGGIEEDNEE